MITRTKGIKAVVVGDGAIGKTCLLMSYAEGEFPSTYVPTVFDNYNTAIVIDQKTYSLGLWDTAGQEEYNRLRVLCYPKTDIFMICFSVVSPTSFDNVKQKWFPEIAHHCPDTPYVLVGTKIDLRGDEAEVNRLMVDGERPLTRGQGEDLAEEIGAEGYAECSALTKDGVTELFEMVTRTAIFNMGELLPEDPSDDKPRKRRGCILL
eukprot:TRINITY_DN7255_c0_g1_i1.p1 TRINITY_DN7255_c0_g1~~TRINITY_DN7255_c0_g1_i1.p1  ORF type:complete len:229 (+),score=22.10 TRINITY_DN7255_c0_g1_i1:68-688(+)